MPSISEQLRAAMAAQHIGIESLAVKAGIHSNTLRRILAGTASPRLSALAGLSAALGVCLRVEPDSGKQPPR